MDETPLENLINPTPESEPATEAPSQPRDESGRFAARETGVDPAAEPETAPEAETVPPTDQLPPETYKGIKEERTKRQALEKELQTLRDQIESLKAPKEPPAPPPSIWEDDQAALQHVKQESVSEASFNAKLDMSEMLAAQAHDDFDDMKAKFLDMMKVNPGLQQQALNARHPWEFAYQQAKKAAQFEELGAVDVADLEAKLREKIMAEMQGTPAPRQTVPPTLTGERNVGTRSGPAWAGPTPLSELLR